MENVIFALLLIAAAAFAIAMSVTDMRRRIIPDVYLFPFMLIGLVVVAFFSWPVSVGESVIAAAFGYGLSFGMGYVFQKIKKTDDSIGLGDVKLLAAGGIWLGATGLAIALGVSCLFAGIWGLRNKQRFIPFAPFFFAGAICSLLAMFFLI